MLELKVPQEAKNALIALIDDIIIHSPIEVMVSPPFVTIFDKELKAYEFSVIKRLHSKSWGLCISLYVWNKIFPYDLRALIDMSLNISKHRIYLPPAQAVKIFNIKASTNQQRVVCIPLKEYDQFASRNWNEKLDKVFQICKSSLMHKRDVV